MVELQAIIFDMDGLLVDTEPLWVRSQVDVLSRLGVPMTSSMCSETTGLRIDEVVSLWKERYPWTEASIEAVAFEIVSRVMALISDDGVLLPGVQHALELAHQQDIPIALASSSPMRLIDHVLHHFSLASFFSLRTSAEGLAYGKPHPEVYLQTAHSLGVRPHNSMAIEDSFFGLLAAKSARMHAIAIPDEAYFSDARWAIADHKLSSLSKLRKEHFSH